jgi:hypothetical protein
MVDFYRTTPVSSMIDSSGQLIKILCVEQLRATDVLPLTCSMHLQKFVKDLNLISWKCLTFLTLVTCWAKHGQLSFPFHLSTPTHKLFTRINTSHVFLLSPFHISHQRYTCKEILLLLRGIHWAKSLALNKIWSRSDLGKCHRDKIIKWFLLKVWECPVKSTVSIM